LSGEEFRHSRHASRHKIPKAREKENAMSTLNVTKRSVINFCLLISVLLCASHQIPAQIHIGGVRLSKPERPNKQNTSQPERITSNTNAATSGGNSAVAQQDALTNPNAPADYNANLNVGAE
jgi:hypothetical protein